MADSLILTQEANQRACADRLLDHRGCDRCHRCLNEQGSAVQVTDELFCSLACAELVHGPLTQVGCGVAA